MRFHFFHNATTHNHGISNGGDFGGAGGIADAEAHANRQLDVLAQHGDFGGDFIGVELCRAGYAFERNVVHKAAGVSGNGLHPRFAGGGGNEENVVDVALREGGLQRGDGFNGIVHGKHAVHACFGSGLGKGLVAHFVDGVQVAHQHNGGVGVALAKLFYSCQHVAQ